MIDLKKALIQVFMILIAGYVMYMAYIPVMTMIVTGSCPAWVSTRFATKVSLRFHYGDKPIDTVITDPKDVRALKGILSGWASAENGIPSCGFDTDISITLTGGHKNITFCPACDGCSKFRIGKTQKYLGVSDAKMERFHKIIHKYGMYFPCI